MTLMLGGIMILGLAHLDPETWEMWDWILESLTDLEFTDIEDGIAVSCVVSLAWIVAASPFLFHWLTLSRLLRALMRLMALIVISPMWWFAAQYGDYLPFLIFLALAPTLTFLGLCVTPRRKQPADTPAP